VSVTSEASIPVTRDAIEVARQAVADFTARGVPAPALLELIARTAPGHRLTAAELPPRAELDEAGHRFETALFSDH